MSQDVRTQRRPRYFLGTFWLGLAVLAFIAGVKGGSAALVLLSPLMLIYSIYLYRGGRYGFIVW